jgi:hypothetical protein
MLAQKLKQDQKYVVTTLLFCSLLKKGSVGKFYFLVFFYFILFYFFLFSSLFGLLFSNFSDQKYLVSVKNKMKLLFSNKTV